MCFVFFVWFYSPFMMTFWLLMFCFFNSLMLKSGGFMWWGYVLFLVYISGLLVVYMSVSSLSLFAKEDIWWGGLVLVGFCSGGFIMYSGLLSEVVMYSFEMFNLDVLFYFIVFSFMGVLFLFTQVYVLSVPLRSF